MQLLADWGYVADRVMGGVSDGGITHETYANRSATVLRGDVSLHNNGGFIQMAFDLRADGEGVDARAWHGITLTVAGNGAHYDLRLRTAQLARPWQSFRTSFAAMPTWQTLRLPFADFTPHKTDTIFDAASLRRIGVLAIGRAFTAEVAVAHIALYRD